MKAKLRSAYALLLAITLVIGLIPAGIVRAADNDKYFHINNLSTSAASPTTTNSNVIDVESTFSGVSKDSITYQVITKVGGNQVYDSGEMSVKPNFTDNNTFVFSGVQLKEGINEIIISGQASSTGAAGNKVSVSAFVSYSNFAVISDVALLDGTNRKLYDNKPIVVTTQSPALNITALNATTVTVNGTKTVGSNGTFVATDLKLNKGMNTLVLVASTSTKSSQVTRQLVYYPQTAANLGMPYNVSIGGQQVDETPTIVADSLSGKITGSMIFNEQDPAPTGGVTNFSATLTKNGSTGDYAGIDAGDVTITPTTSDTGYKQFTFSTSAIAQSITANGTYTLSISGNYGGQQLDGAFVFYFRTGNTPVITQVNQLYNVTAPTSGTTLTAGYSSSVFPDNSTVYELPVWVELVVENAATDYAVTSIQDGKEQTITSTRYTSAEGRPVFKLSKLPSGPQTLTFTATGAGGDSVKTIQINYIPAPFIDLTNVYDGQTFTGNSIDTPPGKKPFTGISGRLVNFAASDLDSLKLTLNGTVVSLNSGGFISANNTFNVPTSPTVKLTPGPNTIVLSGTAGGVPVKTTITVYIFSDDVPVIGTLYPLPVGKLADSTDDPMFKASGTDKFTTGSSRMDVVFGLTNATLVNVYNDGNLIATSKQDPTNKLVWNNATGNLTYTVNPLDYSAQFVLSNVTLPPSGDKTIRIEALIGTTRVTRTLVVTRELSQYSLLSPKLPNENIIKQNFVDVSIKAEGADKIVIGKQEMVKSKDGNDIFRLTVGNLKAGKNTVKFTISQGTQKLNDSFEITYSQETVPGSQFKAAVPTSGKLNVFKGLMSITLPKGTMLTVPGSQDESTEAINLFNSQQMLFGIANPEDGRTVTTYNPVGELDGTGQPLDGQLKYQSSDTGAIATLSTHDPHFGAASNLFWVDAGYFTGDQTGTGDFTTVQGSQPYNKMFYSRNANSYWLAPTQRGTITLKYDSNITNALSSNMGIWKYNPSTGGWTDLGGKINTGSKTVTATLDGFGYYTVMALRYSYDDIISHPTARDDIELVMSRGVMQSKESGEFGVYEMMTRGEFATMLVKMLDIPLDYPPVGEALTFQDVTRYTADYRMDYRYIETAVRKGIIRGVSPRVFLPYGTVTREEAAVMIARAMNLKLGDQAKDLAKLQKTFTDTGSIASPYSITSIQAVVGAKIMSGKANTLATGSKTTYRFDPTATFTRAEGAVITKAIMQKMKKL
ncbi:S-layer protein [Saccharibacillus sp. O23]|uniref:S-layer homology domain-containing protein n=1 Tax=Saccharibacillus sp. O23 TaxID=2009338 RepID=UPI000B4E031D|nr:S-layer homology domain-containing protein [Saccharibacillus sp. O23]OWR26846.1 S-layer protein [Saccharibacillus sp. O23]